jgi:hypothetical protein
VAPPARRSSAAASAALGRYSTTTVTAVNVSVRRSRERAALDSFDLGVGLCLAAGLDEIQLRHALILALNGTEGTMIRDFVVRRREPGDSFVWHVPSSFLDDEEGTPDAPGE